MSDTTTPTGADGLPAKWRERADGYELNGLEADSIGLHEAANKSYTHAYVLRECADELEAALSSVADGEACECGCGRICCPSCGEEIATRPAAAGVGEDVRKVAAEMRSRYAPATGHGTSADVVAGHAVDVAHMLTRWDDRLDAAAPSPGAGGGVRNG